MAHYGRYGICIFTRAVPSESRVFSPPLKEFNKARWVAPTSGNGRVFGRSWSATMLQKRQNTDLDDAFRSLMAHRAMQENYALLLQKEVLSVKVTCDKKALLQFERCLLEQDAFVSLLTIWRETTPSFLLAPTTELLFPRKFGDSISCHKLAVELSPTKQRLAATNARLRGIIDAAQVFGLINLVRTHRTKHSVIATEKLNTFMINLGRLHIDSLSFADRNE